MGLHQADSRGRERTLSPPWMAVLIMAVISLAIAAFGDDGRAWLAFDRAAISAGEYWRLLSGHFTHLSWQHLFYNFVGLSLITFLVASGLKAGELFMIWILAFATVSAGLWFFQPDLQWYVGLSGAQHGLLTAGLVASIGRWGIELWIVAIIVVGKLVYEQLFGALPFSEGASGDAVIIASHFYGALSGCISGASIAIRVRAQASI